MLDIQVKTCGECPFSKALGVGHVECVHSSRGRKGSRMQEDELPPPACPLREESEHRFEVPEPLPPPLYERGQLLYETCRSSGPERVWQSVVNSDRGIWAEQEVRFLKGLRGPRAKHLLVGLLGEVPK